MDRLLGIIAKKNLFRRQHLPLLLILGLAAVLRLWRINELTEFLGDQGRTGLVIYQAWQTKTIPLVGPTVLTGQHLGPFFYYLIAPWFLLANFDPLGASVFMALAGLATVYLLYRLADRLFGQSVGLLISLLWAVSPGIVSQERVIWEPNLIPLFVMAYLWAVSELLSRGRLRHWVIIALLVGILVQLHYPNFILVPWTLLVGWYFVRHRLGTKSWFTFLGWLTLGLGAFVLTLLPFFIYEWQHEMEDLRNLILIWLSSGGGFSQSAFVASVIDLSTRLLGRAIPLGFSPVSIIFYLSVAAVTFWQKSFWHIWLTSLFMAGIVGLSLYRGTIYDHYLNFLLPMPFLFLGFLLQLIRRFVPPRLVAMTVGILVVLQLSRSDIFSVGNHDLRRTRMMVSEMIRRTQGEPFSFTLTGSRSFSDLHYRYFFQLFQIYPRHITQERYQTLFLVCDQLPCRQNLTGNLPIPVLCYEPYCRGEYPKISLTGWRLVDETEVINGKLYMFRRL